jgi:hypothetical protein
MCPFTPGTPGTYGCQLTAPGVPEVNLHYLNAGISVFVPESFGMAHSRARVSSF